MTSTSGGSMGISKDARTPSEFERFRRDRKMRRNQQNVTVARGDRVQRDTIRQIEERERSVAMEQRISREMYEFVEETTRLAATILKDLTAEYQQHHEHHISQEMHEFFTETLRRAEHLTEYMRATGADPEGLQLAVADLEPLLENCSTEQLDEFRAEGSMPGQRHMGHHPVESEAASSRSAEPEENIPEEFEEFEEEDGYGENPDGSFDLEPLGSDEFCDEFADDPRAALEDPLSWRPSSARADEAASENEQAAPEPDEQAAAPSAPETDAPQPPAQGAANAAGESVPGLGLPLGLDGVAGDPVKLRKALTLMVKNGLMSKDDANVAWKQARAHARSGPASSDESS